MKQKIMELYYEKNDDGEKYSFDLPKGVSKMQAAGHMFRAAAEGLMEIQEMFSPLLESLEKEVKKRTSDAEEDTLP